MDNINTVNHLPNHIAYIIDGNGRWALKRGLSRSMGHKAGFKNLQKIVDETFKLGIKYVSIYGFSTENWNRPKEEVDFLCDLFREFVASDFSKEESYIRLNVMGDYARFPKDLVEELEKALERTKHNTKCVLNLGINYGGRDEIVYAVNNLIASGKKQVSAEDISNALYTKGQPDPDFIIRTSGEQRISNFMLWQSAYSEYYFPKIYWPAFNKKCLMEALAEYQKRNRRFGAIKEKE